MTDLALAVRITGDASGLRDAAADAVTAVRPVVSAVDAASGRLTAFGTAAEGAAAATRAIGGAGRDAAAALVPVVSAVEAATGRMAQSTAAAIRAAAGAGAQPANAMAAASGLMAANANTPNLRADQWKNLGFQVNDVVTSLGSGAPAMQVLAQQGGQVFQVLQDAPGGVAGALKIIAGRALGLVTPATLAAGAMAAIGTAGIVAAMRWKSSQDAIEQSLTGIGARSGATVGRSIASARPCPAGGMSAADGRGVASALAGTGRLDVDNIQRVAGLAPGFSKLFGGSLSEAGDSLARIFSDPVKGAAELDARLGSLDDRTQQYIRTLTAQGNRQQAIAVLARSVQPELERAAEATSLWAKAWNAVSGGADTVGKTIVEAFSEGTPQQQAARAELDRRALEANRARQSAVTATQSSLVNNPFPLGVSTAGAAALNAATGKAEHLAEVARRAGQGSFRETRNKQVAEFSTQVGDAVRSLTPEVDQLETLKNRISVMAGAQDSPEVLKKLGVSADRVKEAIEGASGAVGTWMTADQRARASEELTIRAIEARTVAEKAAVAAEQKRIEVANQALAPAEKLRQIEAARTAVLAQSTRDSQDRLRDARDAAASAGLPSYQRQLADLDAKFRKQFGVEAANPAALANAQAQKAAERSAIDKVAIGGPIQDANRALAEQVAALKLQEAAFGASAEAAAGMAAQQQLVNKFLADGIPILDLTRTDLDATRAKITAYAVASGQATATSDDVLRKQRQVVGALDDVRSTTRGGLTGIYSDLRQGKSPWESIKSQLGGFSDRMFERTVSAPLTESLFGQDGKAGGGLFGGALTSLFGKGAGLSTATITAGLVNLNGTVAGLAGLGDGKSALDLVGGSLGRVSGSSLTGDMGRYAAAIKSIESGGNYGALGPITASGDRAYGAYQVMGANIPSWTKSALGTSMSPADFLKDKAAQDATFASKFGGYVGSYGPSGAAQAWFGGPGSVGRGGAGRDILGTSGSDYVRKFNAELAKTPESASAATASLSGFSGDLSSISGPATDASQGLSQLTSALGSGGAGSGLTGMLGKLFGITRQPGGDLGTATAGEVWVASGGHIRGPGTGTSDSIAAWLSHGEFVVNAHATSQHLPLLHDINNHRQPGFAAGGPVTPLVGHGRANDNAPAPAAGGSGAPVLNFITPPGMALQADGEPRQESDGSWTIGLTQLERAQGSRMMRQQGDLHAAAMLSATGGAAGRRG